MADDPQILNARGTEGSTPFMYAVLYTDAPAIERLIKLGADPNKHNDAGATALMWAALTFAAVFSMNVPGSMAAGVAVFCWLCVQPAGERRAAWILAAVSAAFGYAIACYGIPPSSLRTVVGNVGAMHAGFSAGLRAAGPLLLAASLACAAAIGWWLSRTRVALFLRFACLLYTSGPARVFRDQHRLAE